MFVQRRGRRLILDGKPLAFAGANCYYMQVAFRPVGTMHMFDWTCGCFDLQRNSSTERSYRRCFVLLCIPVSARLSR